MWLEIVLDQPLDNRLGQPLVGQSLEIVLDQQLDYWLEIVLDQQLVGQWLEIVLDQLSGLQTVRMMLKTFIILLTRILVKFMRRRIVYR